MTEFIIVCGQRNVGKTTWVCALVEALGKRGLTVGTLKHTHHRHDVEGKDTDRHQVAGAQKVLLVSKTGSALYRSWDDEPSIRTLVDAHFSEADLVLVEGYRQSSHPKFIVGDDPNANAENTIGRLRTVTNGLIASQDLGEALDIVMHHINRET